MLLQAAGALLRLLLLSATTYEGPLRHSVFWIWRCRFCCYCCRLLLLQRYYCCQLLLVQRYQYCQTLRADPLAVA
jgi:hypothetical protein